MSLYDRRIEELACPPTFGTARNVDAPHRGAEIEAHHVALTQGHRFTEWQRYVATVGSELDGNGHRRYLTHVIIIPRQQGKTTYVHSKLTESSRAAPGRSTVYAAQDRQSARYKIIDEFYDGTIAPNPLYDPLCRVRRSNGSEAIRWVDSAAARSVIQIIATNATAGHGLTKIDDVVLDEAFSHADLSITNNVMPLMTAAPDPQIVITSTVGDGSDGLVQHYEEIGRSAVVDPDTSIACHIWMADEDDDRADPAVWARVMPSLGQPFCTVARIKQFYDSMGELEFDRGFLNRRPAAVSLSDIDGEAWADTLDDPDATPTGPLVAAFDIAIDRLSATIAVAGQHPDRPDCGLVIVDRRPGTAWLADELARLTARDRSIVRIVADRRQGAGGTIDTLAGRGVPVVEMRTDDVVTWTAQVVDELAARTFRHSPAPPLDDAAAAAKKRPLGEAFAWSKLTSLNGVDVAPLNAASFAYGAWRQTFPAGAVSGRIT